MTRQRVPNAELYRDTARQNLLTNGGFEIWQRGNGPFTTSGILTADRWQTYIAGGDTLSIAKSTATVDTGSSASAQCTYTRGTGRSVLQETLRMGSDGPQLRGRSITFSVRVRASAANAIAVNLSSDGTGGPTSTSTYHTGAAAFETLSVTLALPADATFFNAGVYFDQSCTAYLDNAMLVVGNVAADYAPMHPADDLARCQRYYHATDNTNALIHSPGLCTGTAAARCVMMFPVQMAVVPTVTFVNMAGMNVVNNVGNLVAWSTVSASITGVRSTCLLITTPGFLATGDATYCTWNSAASINLEANP